MKNVYMLKNIRTGVIEYDNLYAQDVHDLIGINKSCISKYEKSKSVYNGTWRIMMSSGTELWTEYTRDAWAPTGNWCSAAWQGQKEKAGAATQR